MKGFRTLVAAFVGTYLSPLAVKYLGHTLSPEEQLQLVALIMGGLMTGFRVITRTQVGATQEVNLSERQIVAICNMVIRHLLRRAKK